MKKPFKIGIWINEDDLPEIGGGFSYTDRLIKGINLKEFDERLKIVFIGFNLKGKFNKEAISIPFNESYFQKKKVNFYHKFFSLNLERKDISKNYLNAISLLKSNDIQLIFYTNPYIALNNFPYICINWDLGHKSTFSFPELTMNGEFIKRDTYFNKVLNEALIVCCESDKGKEELTTYFNINPDRIRILPMFPGRIVDPEIEMLKPEWITSDTLFFLYPAQFWSHKNHYNLINGFKLFCAISKYTKYKLVLTGSDKGNLNYIKNFITESGLEHNIIIPGFIKNEELKWLYKNAEGLVFPSFLGPTNMPLLEALSLGCPIACSNLTGHAELLGSTALYFDPTNEFEIFNAMLSMTKGKKKPSPGKSNIDQELQILESIFIDSIPIRKTWGQFDKIK
ncbi:glycosyltransferase [uncultured Pedobacter sp.]|uniref:glycosyltransferase n=1 Tax=uncultured Pedobacter sp. TaxID=246139 RepID=UPI0025ECC27D|nr:glycosyltransferase [uncultured Pedobacter sp.]